MKRQMLLVAVPIVAAVVVSNPPLTRFSNVALAEEIPSAGSNRETPVAPNAGSSDFRLEPFHKKSTPVPDGTHWWKKWHRVVIDLPDELATVAACSETRCSVDAARKFRKILDKSVRLKGRSRLDEVNRDVNHTLEAQSDTRNHGVPDHWSTPFETLRSGKGDCEDYAITKYALLRAMNWPQRDLRLVVVYFTTTEEYHAILAVHFHHGWVILDNLTDAIKQDMTLRKTYHPLLIVDESSAVHLLADPSPADEAKIAELNKVN